VNGSEQKYRIRYEKEYSINVDGSSDVIRSTTIENLTHNSLNLLDLDLEEHHFIEDFPDLTNIQAYDREQLEYKAERTNARTFLSCKLRIKTLDSLQSYKITFEYKIPAFARKINNIWVIKDSFVLSDKAKTRREYEIRYKLPLIKKWYQFWIKIKAACLVDGQPLNFKREGSSIIFEHEFALNPGYEKIVTILYTKEKIVWLISFVFSIIGAMITRLISLIFGI